MKFKTRHDIKLPMVPVDGSQTGQMRFDSELIHLVEDNQKSIIYDFEQIQSQIDSGLSGTLTLDDGANWRITLTFTNGILTGKTTGASTGAAGTWT